MTLRDAAERTSRSVTTLRRYIRAGRLRADKAHGRYGPEYLIAHEALEAAGLRPAPAETAISRPSHEPAALAPLEQALRECVPVGLYQELQMKHEQLLVQYGMVRAGGLHLIELRGELEERERRLAESAAENRTVSERAAREAATLRKRLRETELELEGRTLELAALREKLRTLERMRGTAPPQDGIERQVSDVAEQMRRVERLESLRHADGTTARGWISPLAKEEPEH